MALMDGDESKDGQLPYTVRTLLGNVEAMQRGFADDRKRIGAIEDDVAILKSAQLENLAFRAKADRAIFGTYDVTDNIYKDGLLQTTAMTNKRVAVLIKIGLPAACIAALSSLATNAHTLGWLQAVAALLKGWFA
jgi:hypothetical protein